MPTDTTDPLRADRAPTDGADLGDRRSHRASRGRSARWSGWVLAGAVALACVPLGLSAGTATEALAQEHPVAEVALLSRSHERAIRRALDYIASRQHADGYWVGAIGKKVNNTYKADMGRHIGVTSLACMAMLANGSTPGRGPYGEHIQKGLDFVIAQVDKSDGFVSADGSRMYSHGFATLFLAEVYGMSQSDNVREGLQSAVSCLVEYQNAHGGWRYNPGAPDADISITVTAVQALRAARNVGIHVPSETIVRAIAYVKKSFIRSHYDPNWRSGFFYQVDGPFSVSRTSFALTAAGVTALFGAGDYDSPEVRGGLEFLLRPKWRPKRWEMDSTFSYFYGHYYASQAFYQAGGPLWRRWFESVRDEFLSGVNDEGHWEDLVGPVYATAIATIVLQIPYGYLPIFER